jgi:hypothetical protein
MRSESYGRKCARLMRNGGYWWYWCYRTTPMEIEEVPQVLPDQFASLQRTPPVDPSAAHLSIQSTGTEFHSRGPPLGSTPAELTPAADLLGTSSQHTPAGDPRGPSSSVQSTPAGDPRDTVPPHSAPIRIGVPHPLGVRPGFASQVGSSGPHTLTHVGQRDQG